VGERGSDSVNSVSRVTSPTAPTTLVSGRIEPRAGRRRGGVHEPGRHPRRAAVRGERGGDGNVTYEEAFTVQPFGNSLVTMTLTGAQIETMLEQQFCGINASFNRVLQPSAGFTYTWNGAAAEGPVAPGGPVTGPPAAHGTRPAGS
jgi:5'-nucleotidase, C-terminal domain